MRSITAVLYVGFVVLSVSASSNTIQLTKVNRTPSLQSIAQADRARASSLTMKHKTPSAPVIVPATDHNLDSYIANVGIGSPPTLYSLFIDTGSSNTWVGAGAKYLRTSTSVSTGQNVDVTYGSGSFSGVEYTDSVTLAPNLVIKQQSIGDADQSQGFQGFDGVLGLGPVDLTVGTLSTDPDVEIPTVMNNAFGQGLIDSQIFGVSFAPSTSQANDNINGALTIGGTNHSYYLGEIIYTPITQTSPSSGYWGIDATAKYGSEAIIETSVAGIVDTGTTLLLLSKDYFTKYMNAIPGALQDPVSGFLAIPIESVKGMQPLTIRTGDAELILDVAAQLFPAEDTSRIGSLTDVRYAIANLMDASAGLDFILGMTVMQRFYTVFDADKQRIGFAYTDHTFTKPAKV